MLEVIGYSVQELPLKNLNKISDLIDFDGPILSHFKDESGNDFLFYWVDYDTHFNRWLIWRVTSSQLFDFLSGLISLRNILLEKNKDFIYVVDIDSDLKYHNIMLSSIQDISVEYIPEEQSFIRSAFPSIYDTLREQSVSNEYLYHMRKNAISFTLEPNRDAFSTTISALDASDFLKKISNSFLYFVEFDFFNSFKNALSDVAKLNRIIKRFKEILSPRVVNLQYSSFNVSISADTVQSVEYGMFKEWQIGILDKFKEEVIEIDLGSELVLRNIAEKYPLEARKSIFSPIIDIINDKNYNLKITDHKKRIVKRFSSIDKAKADIILARKAIPEDKGENRKLVSLIVQISDREDINRIGKRELQTGLLFMQEVSEFPFIFEEIKADNIRLVLRVPLECNIKLENNTYYLSIPKFDISAKADNLEDGKGRIQRQCIAYYRDFLDNPQEYDNVIAENILSIVEREEKL